MSDHRPSERMLIAPARSEQWKLLLHDRNFDSSDKSCIDQISILFSSRLLICPICLYFRRPSKKRRTRMALMHRMHRPAAEAQQQLVLPSIMHPNDSGQSPMTGDSVIFRS